MLHTEQLAGTIERFVYQNPDNGYAVFILQLSATSSVTVTGMVPSTTAGQHISLRGSWKIHPKFGKQFEASSYSVMLPTNREGLKKYLSSGMIKGIGPVYAEKLVNHFGTTVLEIIDKQPQRLQEVAGIGASRAQKICAAWQDQKEISSIMIFLQEKGISPLYALKIYKTYGMESIAKIQENPYRLADDIWGIGFKIADDIAHKLGLEKHGLPRIRAGIIYALSQATMQGHLYLELQQLKDTTRTLLELDTTLIEPLMKNALHQLYDEQALKLISYQDQHFLGLSKHYFTEKGIAQKIVRLRDYQAAHTFDINAIYNKMRAPQHERDILLNEEQQHGIITCLQNKITIITGGPGTGKTTLIKKLLSLLDEYKITYRLAAPTGKAAKRMTQSTGRHAVTLHRLLEYDVASRSFTHNEQQALKLDLLIIDEASMVDVFLAYAVLKAVPLHARLVFLGDIDQLPSVGAGNFLNDLINSSTIPCIRLKQIFRQAHDSLIIVNAHRVNQGEFPVSFLPDAKKDFLFIKEDNPEMVLSHLKEIFTRTLPRLSIHHQDAVVLTPMNRGMVGTYALNQALQTLLNPNPGPQCTVAGTTFKIGDQVMQIRNNYEKLVFNGDTGFITQIDESDRTMTVKFHEREITYESNEVDELVLAYAMTIHKSQGSEYAAVIIPLFMQHYTLLQRNLLYTAITRAKKMCILIGQAKAIGMAINNNKTHARTTFLQQFLTTDLTCR